ncbi:hypothetical protein BDZ94DRAFT_1278186 [Collybia nuda]|uniref:Secreted protein n=1 Tax=Collybia nuda TaxID=64659 RepID=A0A9P6CBT6_9AGAR|nr:hypothetical protein BDZ94DRAFT_1278186 [Collybia nuda]
MGACGQGLCSRILILFTSRCALVAGLPMSTFHHELAHGTFRDRFLIYTSLPELFPSFSTLEITQLTNDGLHLTDLYATHICLVIRVRVAFTKFPTFSTIPTVTRAVYEKSFTVVFFGFHCSAKTTTSDFSQLRP